MPIGITFDEVMSGGFALGQIDTAAAALAVNPNLQSQPGPLLPQIAIWIWGHEHDMVIYDKQMDILARCLGHGGVPVLPGDAATTPKHPEITANDAIRPQLNGEFMSHGYAIMKLNGPSATIDYYMDDEDTSVMTDNL